MAVVTIPGVTSGSATRQKAWNLVAPSTIAASSSDTGRSAKKAFMSQIAKGRLKVR